MKFVKKLIGYMLILTGFGFFGLSTYDYLFKKVSLSANTKTSVILSGKVDSCCSEFGIVRELNNKLNPILLRLVETNFFRLFKVNLESECPFWALDHICKEKTMCGICYCDDHEIPSTWKKEDEELIKSKGKLLQNQFDYYTRRSMSPAEPSDWIVGEDDENGIYVDLVKNVEAFTGYQGQKIWDMIYNENCFKSKILLKIDDQCMEERLLFKAVSGMHSSVSSHLSEYHNSRGDDGKYKPNIKMYFEKVGNHQELVQNLYFAYSILLRAFKKASEMLLHFDISTTNFQDDLKTGDLLREAVGIARTYPDIIFDEASLFKEASKEALKGQLKGYFYNISRIMDCVECEKCKTYGKMQIKGLGTALKMLFDDKFKTLSGLKRNELIAFVNTLTKWSTSLIIFDKMIERQKQNKSFSFIASGAIFLLLVLFSVALLKARDTATSSLNKKLASACRNLKEKKD